MADTRILPHGLKPEAYPSDEAIAAQLEGYHVVTVDVLNIALSLGDPKGRCANVAMLGVLSTLPPFDVVPEAVWLQALKGISRKPALWDLNHGGFHGRSRDAERLIGKRKDVGEGALPFPHTPSPPPKTFDLSNPSCRFP